MLVCCQALANIDIDEQKHPYSHQKTNAFSEPDMDLYLKVILNGNMIKELVHFSYYRGELCMSYRELQDIGFRLKKMVNGYCLHEIKGVDYSYNSAMQEIKIQAPLEILDLKLTQLNNEQQKATPPTSGAGIVVNYDIYANGGDDQDSINSLTEFRGFANNLGTLSHTTLLQYNPKTTNTHDGSYDIVSLDTKWYLPLYSSGLSLVIGDAVTYPLPWSRSIRIGGVALGSDFAQRPYEIMTPMPKYFGNAVLPSTIELYVDGMQQYHANIPAGPFQVTSPGVNYNGNAQIIMVDALGRVSTINFPNYSPHRLLRSGLNEWVVEAGKIRNEYGLKSFRYGNSVIGSATLRRGITSELTLETHAEGSSNLFSMGTGIVWNLVSSNVVDLSVATSKNGNQYGFGYSWTGKFLNFSFNSLQSDKGYRDIASDYGRFPPHMTQQLSTGISLQNTALNINVTRLRYRQHGDYQYAGININRSIGNGISLGFGYSQNLKRRNDKTFFANLSISLKQNISLNSSSQRRYGQTFLVTDLTSSMDDKNGIGWRLQEQRGRYKTQTAEFSMQGSKGEITIGGSNFGSGSRIYGGVRGALVMMQGNLFSTRHIDNAFAVVSSGELAGVSVLQDNHFAGKTNDQGLLLVPRLNAWQDNILSIDPRELPPEVHIPKTEMKVAPAGNVGTLVSFPIRKIHALNAQLSDVKGIPLPVGTTIIVSGQQKHYPVGYDGMVYLEGLFSSYQTLMAFLPDGSSCEATPTFSRENKKTLWLKPYVCKKVKK
ncbi:fimbrial biogenesis outer membrane usher protein [Salmonella enterica]|nr:fimbrial biogenesis outer membrane usher protein [Salmonella enterica]